MILFLTELMLLQYIKQELGILILEQAVLGQHIPNRWHNRLSNVVCSIRNRRDLPSATDQHGMFAHVHGTGKGYFAHAAAWVKLVDYNDGISALTDVDTTVNGGPSDGQVLKWNEL